MILSEVKGVIFMMDTLENVRAVQAQRRAETLLGAIVLIALMAALAYYGTPVVKRAVNTFNMNGAAVPAQIQVDMTP